MFALMATRFDFAALDPTGKISLLVEAKSKLGTDAVWARELRGLIAERAPIVASGTFLLVTPDRLYVWAADERLESSPTVLDGTKVLGKHLEHAGARPDRAMDPRAFEAVVLWWLKDIATGVADTPPGEAFAPVARALRSGRIVSELAA